MKLNEWRSVTALRGETLRQMDTYLSTGITIPSIFFTGLKFDPAS